MMPSGPHFGGELGAMGMGYTVSLAWGTLGRTTISPRQKSPLMAATVGQWRFKLPPPRPHGGPLGGACRDMADAKNPTRNKQHVGSGPADARSFARAPALAQACTASVGLLQRSGQSDWHWKKSAVVDVDGRDSMRVRARAFKEADFHVAPRPQ